MEKKRSIGVTIFAWVFIILAILGWLSLLSKPCGSRGQICSIGSSMFKSYLRAIYLFLMPTLSLIAGIFILRLKEWARKLAIALRAAIVILFIVNWIPFLSINKPSELNVVLEEFAESKKQETRQNVERLYKPEHQQEYLKKQEEVLDMTAKAMPAFIYSVLLLALGWNGIIIFFFTRPKVKRQFVIKLETEPPAQ